MTRVSKADVTNAVEAAATTIPLGFFIATAQHESGFNAGNQEPNDQEGGSWGIYALGPREFASELGMSVDISQFLDLYQATDLFARLSEARVERLRAAAGLGPYDDADGELWAYLFLAHNQGIGAAIKTIENNGLDWEAYVARNAGNPKLGGFVSYGNDVIAAVKAYGGPTLTLPGGYPVPLVPADTSSAFAWGIGFGVGVAVLLSFMAA